MSWGRDIRVKDLVMVPGETSGSLEPQLLAPTRQAIRAAVAARIDAYTPEWTDRRPEDAGLALVRTYGTVAEAVDVRINAVPRRLVLDHLGLAGVHALRSRPAEAVLGIAVAPRATAAVDVPAGSAFLAPGGPEPVVIETLQSCRALPGTLASVAVLVDGWTVDDDPTDLGGLAPFGPRPQVPAELWLGVDSPVAPAVLLSFAIEFVPAAGRTGVSSVPTTPAPPPPTIRWEAMTSAGASELAVERDETAGLSGNGVVSLRAGTPAPWTPRTLPGRDADAPYYWLRARLVTNDYPADLRLARITLNGVAATASRSIRGEALLPLERSSTGRSSYRLSQIPVVPGSVLIDVADSSSDPFGTEAPDDLTTAWTETDDLAGLESEDRRFALDATAGIVTFGDGVHGRAVPDGYRNVVARVYAAGGGTTGLPAPGDTIAPQRSVPGLTGATVLTITTGADPEDATKLARRGPGELRSRGRAVAATDYATLALAAEGVDVARAHCLAATDPRSPASVVPGLVGVVVVPAAGADGRPPTPSPETLRAVADHLAREVGVVGAEVVAAAPVYRTIAVEAVLVARAGSDLAAVGSAARDLIDAWLNPLTGAGGAGWPFGGPVHWDVLSRLLLDGVGELTAVSRLALRIDGRRLPACTDAALRPDELTWPGLHVIEVVAEGAPS